MKRFDGQSVIVTGGTRGIGRALSLAFLREGARVVATYRQDDEAAQALKADEGEMAPLNVWKCDLTKSCDIEALFEKIEVSFEGLDILVNNGGVRRDALSVSMEEAEWDLVLDTNLKGAFLMAKAAIPLMMKKRYGRIVNISSMSASLGLMGQGNYAASKAGQVALGKVLSKEVARKGITVNTVLPGFIETDLIRDLPPEQLQEYKKSIPMRRFGTPLDVASAVLFLASREASYITGATLEVSGGPLSV